MNQAVVLEGVYKRYRRSYDAPQVTSLKSLLTHDLWRKWVGRAEPPRAAPSVVSPWALQDIALTVPKGQTLGMIGRNGSGKSTLLKLLGRILAPDRGQLAINGKVAALIELGAGFHPELTGRENVLINGVIMGLSKSDMRARMEAIIDFAEAQAFINSPVRTYSSGMYARLGFSVAMHVDADILLIDEVLSVGDATFTAKCRGALDAMRRQGKSIIVVSHDLHTISTWCDQAVWLEGGKLIQQGPAAEVVQAYQHKFAAPATA
jgi:lipopolysaccharide transport system ATP-binding protein